MSQSPSSPESFSSRAFLERAADPAFLLNAKRRLRYANPAFEKLVRQPLADLYNLPCVRDRRVEPLGQTLAPPPEVLAGSIGVIRRPVPPSRVGPPWWDIAFFPFRSPDGSLLGVIGRIQVVGSESGPRARALPDPVLQLRRKLGQRYSLSRLEGESPASRRLASLARLASRLPVPISLVGEPGSGKRFVARIIHHQGAMAERGFVLVDCAALDPESLERLLFGEVGLDSARTGCVYFRAAANLPRDLQLRVVEWWQRRASDAPRLVAGWHSDPADHVRGGQILAEFAEAMGLFRVDVPPLRCRLEDLPRLAGWVLEGTGKTVSDSALAAFRRYAWPGNLREFIAVLRAAAERSSTEFIDVDHLPEPLRSPVVPVDRPMIQRSFPLKDTLREMQRRLILFALRRARGRKAEAARLLDISRSELWRRMAELGISEDGWRGEMTE